MPFVKDETEQSKHRIVEVAQGLFSEKGFDATRVEEIAKAAGVNKALIYYYFTSKQAILDHLIATLLEDFEAIAMTFVESSILTRIEKGTLDILRDRWRFASEQDAQDFMDAGMQYYEKVIDFALSRRAVIRILVFESLKDGKHKNALFRMLDLLYTEESTLHQTIANADQDFAYSHDNVVFKVYFGLIPLFNFAAYVDDHRELSGRSEPELRASFLRSYETMAASHLDGTDIVLSR